VLPKKKIVLISATIVVVALFRLLQVRKAHIFQPANISNQSLARFRNYGAPK
jgi:hypothetical protein